MVQKTFYLIELLKKNTRFDGNKIKYYNFSKIVNEGTARKRQKGYKYQTRTKCHSISILICISSPLKNTLCILHRIFYSISVYFSTRGVFSHKLIT